MHAHHQHRPCHSPVPAAYPGLLALLGSAIALTSATLWGGARVVKRVVEGSLWQSHDCGHHAHCCCHHYTVECRPPCGCHSHCGCGCGH